LGRYIGSLLLLHFEGEAFGGAVEAEVVAAGQHQDIFRELLAFGARLRLVHCVVIISEVSNLTPP
jgi:hypothetical protein